jgi:hydrogenase expression/formation protein HypE
LLCEAVHGAATRSRVGIRLEESSIPVREMVRGACEVLGLDPVYVANEGKLVPIVSVEDADAILSPMRRHPLGANTNLIGEISDQHAGYGVDEDHHRGTRILHVPVNEQLPRIC